MRVECEGSLGRVVMDRPGVRNAFDAEAIEALRDAFERMGVDPGVRAIVLSGEGRSFCGGADIDWMRAALGLGEAENVRDAETLARMFETIDRCPKPVVARVQGAALGGGAGLAAVADIVVAADDATFGFTEVKLGILPAVISPYVVAKIGASHARRLFLTGERFDATIAERIGLVHHVVPEAMLDARIAHVIGQLGTSGAGAMAAVKELLRALPALDAEPERRTALAARAIARQRVGAEGQEGLRAFLERRRATWCEPSPDGSA